MYVLYCKINHSPFIHHYGDHVTRTYAWFRFSYATARVDVFFEIQTFFDGPRLCGVLIWSYAIHLSRTSLGNISFYNHNVFGVHRWHTDKCRLIKWFVHVIHFRSQHFLAIYSFNLFIVAFQSNHTTKAY